MIQGLGECHDERIERSGRWHRELPVGHVDRRIIRADDVHRLSITLFERLCVRVRPVAIDDQRVVSAGFEHGPQLFARHQPSLHAPGIEEQRKASHVAVPKFFPQLEKDRRQLVPLGVEQVHVSVRLAASHRGREVQVELQEVLGQPIGRGINVRDPGNGRRGARRREREVPHVFCAGSAASIERSSRTRYSSPAPKGYRGVNRNAWPTTVVMPVTGGRSSASTAPTKTCKTATRRASSSESNACSSFVERSTRSTLVAG